MAKRKMPKWLRVVLLSLLALLIAGVVAFKLIGLDELREFVMDEVKKDTQGRYDLTLDKLDFSLLKGKLHLGNGHFKRDYTVDAYTGAAFLDEFDIDASFTSLDVSAFKVILFVLTNEIDVTEMKLVDPKLIITKNQQFAADSPALAQAKQQELADSTALEELKEASREFFPPITVEALTVKNGSFEFHDGIVDYPIQMAAGVNLKLTGVYYEDGQNIYSADNLSFRVDTAETLLSKNTARLSVSDIHISRDTFFIDHLRYLNIVSPSEVNRIKGFRATWLDIRVTDIDLPSLDLRSMVEQKAVLIPKLEIGDVKLQFRKDKHAEKINPAYKALPHELLNNIPVTVKMDTLVVKNAFLDIEMLAAKAIKYGHLTVDTAALLITNFTNDQAALAENDNLRLRLDAKVNKVVPAFAEFNFDLDSPSEDYTCHLHAGPMDATVLNNFIGSQFFVEFSSGQVQQIDMRYRGDKKANVGEMDFEYTNLRMRKLEHAELFIADGKTHRGFLAWIGNVLVPKNHHSGMKKYETSLIYYEREYNRDFIHAMVMSLLSGITSTLGFGNQSQETIQKKYDALSEQDFNASAEKAQKKADDVDRKKEHEQKKAERQRKKEEKKKKKKNKD